MAGTWAAEARQGAAALGGPPRNTPRPSFTSARDPAARRQRRAPPPRAGPWDAWFGGGAREQRQAEQAEPERGVGPGEEEGTFVRLDEQSEGSVDGSQEEPFGPLALLAVGFTGEEFGRLQRLLLEELEAEMVKLLPATAEMLGGTLGDALESQPQPFAQMPLGTRHVVFLSGMYAGEVMEVVAAYRQSGLPEAAFAAAVSNSWGRELGEVVQDVFADHRAMRQRAAGAQQQQQGSAEEG